MEYRVEVHCPACGSAAIFVEQHADVARTLAHRWVIDHKARTQHEEEITFFEAWQPIQRGKKGQEEGSCEKS
jgi:hypothetical protein